MKYTRLGTSDLNVSAIGMGTWAIGGDFFGNVDDQTSIRAIQAGIDAGITLIDTAPAYGAGHAEEVVGKAIKGRRDSVVVASKVGVIRHPDSFERNLKPELVRQEIEDSLRRLGVDTIDLYQIHWPDKKTPLEDAMEVLVKAHEAGKFRYFGVSNFTIDLMDEVRKYDTLVSLQPHFSMLKRDIEPDIQRYCMENDIGILGYGSLAGGILTGKYRELPQFEQGDNRANFYPWFREAVWDQVQALLDVLRAIANEHSCSVAQVTIAWTIRQPGMTSALVGAKNGDQAIANAAGADVELSSGDLERIDEAYRANFARPA
jgi:aryl-alcohol dehydrogenase-like predicted oxidoreductase